MKKILILFVCLAVLCLALSFDNCCIFTQEGEGLKTARFNLSSIIDGNTSIITVPADSVDLGNVPQTPLTGALTDNVPTDTEIDNLTGVTPPAKGWNIILEDASSGEVYIAVSNGTNWFYIELTEAVNP